ncbi:Uclacyanin 1, partial [Bienertia sinuspersici]
SLLEEKGIENGCEGDYRDDHNVVNLVSVCVMFSKSYCWWFIWMESLLQSLSLWSSTSSFFVNDSLVSINSPISTYFDEFGQTVIPMSQPGWRYFICGRSNYCSLGLKLSIQVLYEISMPINTVSQDTKDQPGNSIRKMADYLLMATVNSIQSLWLKSLWGLCASSIFQ